VAVVATDSAPGIEGEVLFVRGSGASALVACHWTRSPAGPFAEVMMVRPSRRRLDVTTLAVGSREVAPAPDRAAALRWWSGGRRRELLWEARGLRLRLEAGAAWVPAVLPVRALHPEWRGHDLDRPPGRLSPARVQVEVPEDDPLAFLAGRRRGILVSSGALGVDEFRFFLARPARVPPAAEPS
jgi:hypothetical protein